MKIKEIFSGYECEILNKNNEVEVNNIEVDTRKVEKGNLFLCISGENYDSHNSIDQCYEKGVRNFVISKEVTTVHKDINLIKVKNSRECLAYVSKVFFGNRSDKFKKIGVTGTNGKTSTVYFIDKILSISKYKVGTIGTLGIKVKGEDIKIPFTTSTTPDILDMQKVYKEFENRGVDLIGMEVSSHGLELNRVTYEKFEIGVFTNLTQEHLDFHKTLDNYYKSKKKLFYMCKTSIINIDDDYGKKLEQELKKINKKVITISKEVISNYKASNIKYKTGSTSYEVEIGGKKEKVKVNIPGEFTVYNTLTAIVCCYELGMDINVILESLKKIKGVTGRIEPVVNNKGLNVFIDYAHTPDALEQVIKSVKKNTKGKTITVFGCGGDRDKSKRKVMGEVSSYNSDIAIVTSDNPRTENRDEIIKDILEGTDKNICVEPDREKAIKKAIEMATKEDSVIIAGKGHEDYQIIGNIKYDFSDYEIAKKIMEED